jgi:3-hydroxyisobutyrate dehydrogenase-like beta-hydroxyacid dehydrogenase
VTVVGLLHPGEMGAAVGNALVAAGHTVLWASEGRSEPTRARAAAFDDAGTATELAARSDVVFSIVPPHAARDVAASVQPFGGIYVDANAVAPETARSLGAPRFVDGGIVGGPPAPRLYLSGAEAAEVAQLFAGSPIESVVVADASALKCAYAAWTKGSAALALAAREYARRTGVEQALLAEWEQLGVQAEESRVAAKAWRFVGEMEEIANAFADEDLPPGFHEAAAEIYRSIGRPTVDGSVNAGGSSE